jgi:uncharacterized protein YgbK (DUF1537 family)
VAGSRLGTAVRCLVRVSGQASRPDGRRASLVGVGPRPAVRRSALDVATAIERDGRRVVVLDDDPTGTQAVSDVDVVLAPSSAAFDRFFGSGERALYVLTNTRAMVRDAAVATLRDVHARVAAAASRAAAPWTAVLRGDSTLRGHVFAEVDAIAGPDAVCLFVPAFPAGGRTTHDGRHWVVVGGRRRNVADTEFARDATFGFSSRDIVGWVAEVGGRRRARIVPLDEIRRHGDALSGALLNAPVGTVVIPEIETEADVEIAVLGLLSAEAAGRSVVVRCASSFAAARAGLRPRTLDRVALAAPGRILVACGSHTQAASAQLRALTAAGWPTLVVGPDDDPAVATDEARRRLARDRVAVVATPRDFVAGTTIDAGSRFLAPLDRVVAALRTEVEAVVAKGGITSAVLARRLGADVARVAGQLDPGVALWSLDRAPGRLPFVVVPGNVGNAGALVRVVGRLATAG